VIGIDDNDIRQLFIGWHGTSPQTLKEWLEQNNSLTSVDECYCHQSLTVTGEFSPTHHSLDLLVVFNSATVNV